MSSTFVGPVVGIDGPLPIAPAYNLLEVARELDDDVRWQNGVSVWAFPTALPGFDDPCATGSVDAKGTGAESPRAVFEAFTAYIPDRCSGMGIGPWEEFKARANSVLTATEAWAAERQLVQGVILAGNPWLGDSRLNELAAGAPVDQVQGLSLLEEEIAKTGRMGVIHAPPGVTTAWASRYLVEEREGRLYTVANRTPVVSGYGYVGADPVDGATPAAGQGWAFATGPLFFGRGELVELDEDIAQTLNTANNDLVYRAERDLIVGWDTALQAGVLIDWSPVI